MRKGIGDMVDQTRFNNLNLQNMEAQRRIAELEDQLQLRADHTAKLIQGMLPS